MATTMTADGAATADLEGGPGRLKAWRPTSPAASLGLAVEYLSGKPAFAALPFGAWSQVLFHQVARNHFFFVVDAEQKMQGFLGWALTDQDMADQWVDGRAILRNHDSQQGDCVIVNAFAAETPQARQFVVDAVRSLFASKSALYFKRHYRDGRTRTTRLAPNAFTANHCARARQRQERDDQR
jgi:hemolysin-activating ACP:hemolysin acyltransferase